MSNKSPIQLLGFERETIITFNEAEPDAHIITYNKKLQRRLTEICQEFPDVATLEDGEEGDLFIECTLPKKLIQVRKPVVMSEKHRKAASERMKQMARDREQASLQDGDV